MQRHNVHAVFIVAQIPVHHQGHVFEKTAEIFKLTHRAHKFFKVFEAAFGFGAFVVLPHFGVARLVEHDFGQLRMGQHVHLFAPAGETFDQQAQCGAGLARQLVSEQHFGCRDIKRGVAPAGRDIHFLDRALTNAALGCVDDALEGQIMIRRGDDF